MFNRELKKQVAELQSDNKSIFERLWQLENPPKYKVGQSVKGTIVTEVKIIYNAHWAFEISMGLDSKARYMKWQYTAIKKGMDKPVVID